MNEGSAISHPVPPAAKFSNIACVNHAPQCVKSLTPPPGADHWPELERGQEITRLVIGC